MKEHKVGIIMNGVTGRMGTNQHLIRSILAIREQGGIRIDEGETIYPEPILVGRNEDKLRKLAERTGVKDYTTDLDNCLSDERYSIYFDSQRTDLRPKSILKAIAAGKNIYCEKPTALSTEEALGLYKAAQEAGVKNGVVQDKLWLPGLLKLKMLIDSGFFGRILSVRGEFGYWVFEGEYQPCQRPSWNYRKEDGGGIILDMLCHWRYVIDNLFGEVRSVTALGAHHVPKRRDEQGKEYDCTAEDAAYAIFVSEKGVVCNFNSSWCVRVRRDDLFVMQVDGDKGSAVVGMRECYIQPAAATPKPIWNPDIEQPIDFFEDWQKVPNNVEYDNAFKAQWELFLKHVVTDSPFLWTLLEGAKGVQLAESGYESWKEKRWIELEPLI